MGHVDEVLKEALVINDHQDYQDLLEARDNRFEELYVKKAPKVTVPGEGDDSSPDLVTH